MSDGAGRPVTVETKRTRMPLVRFRAEPGAVPMGAIFGAVALVAGVAVRLLHLDRLPYVFCTFKLLTGLPCPTCGSTRTLGRLFALDLPGAISMNPLAMTVALLVLVWAVWDTALLPSRRALRVELHPSLVVPVRVVVVAGFLLNWVYLLHSGR